MGLDLGVLWHVVSSVRMFHRCFFKTKGNSSSETKYKVSCVRLCFISIPLTLLFHFRLKSSETEFDIYAIKYHIC